jgi:preprotein translocase subunit SecG
MTKATLWGALFGGSSSSAFGSRSGNILTRTTSILGTLFVAIILGMVFIFNSPETIVESDIDFNPEIETQVAPEGETTIDGNITVPSETDESDN